MEFIPNELLRSHENPIQHPHPKSPIQNSPHFPCARTAFRRLALLVHPDKNPGEEAEKSSGSGTKKVGKHGELTCENWRKILRRNGELNS